MYVFVCCKCWIGSLSWVGSDQQSNLHPPLFSIRLGFPSIDITPHFACYYCYTIVYHFTFFHMRMFLFVPLCVLFKLIYFYIPHFFSLFLFISSVVVSINRIHLCFQQYVQTFATKLYTSQVMVCLLCYDFCFLFLGNVQCNVFKELLADSFLFYLMFDRSILLLCNQRLSIGFLFCVVYVNKLTFYFRLLFLLMFCINC